MLRARLALVAASIVCTGLSGCSACYSFHPCGMFRGFNNNIGGYGGGCAPAPCCPTVAGSPCLDGACPGSPVGAYGDGMYPGYDGPLLGAPAGPLGGYPGVPMVTPGAIDGTPRLVPTPVPTAPTSPYIPGT